MPTVDLTFSALAAHVRTARLVAVAMARRTGVAEDLLDEVRLAVGEACARAVELHRRQDPTVPVALRFDDERGRFSVSVLDRAAGTPTVAGVPVAGAPIAPPAPTFPVGGDRGGASDGAGGRISDLVDYDAVARPAPGDAGPEPLDDLLPAGFGLAVIAGLVDHVEVGPRPDGRTGTVVRMSWPVEHEVLPTGLE